MASTRANGAPAHYQQVWGVSKQMAPRPGNTPVYSATTKVALPANSADEIHATDAYPFKDIPGVFPSTFVAGNDTTHTNIQNMFSGLTFGPNIYFPALVSAGGGTRTSKSPSSSASSSPSRRRAGNVAGEP